MSSRYAPFALLPLLAIACATGESITDPGDPGVDASPDAPIADAGRDTGRVDAGADAADATLPSDDAGDASASDASDAADAAVDASKDAAVDAAETGSDASVDANDGAVTCTPFDAGACSGSVNVCGTATATSTYVGPLTTYSASRVIDGDLGTSWFAASNACPNNTCAGNITVTVTLRQTQTIGRVKLFANREFASGFNVLTARIELLDANDAVLRQVNVAPSTSGADIDQAILPAQSCVRKIRIVPLTGEDPGPGFAEIQIFPS